MKSKISKHHKFTVSFENGYYDIVRSVVDNFRRVKLIGHANGKGMFNSGILVTEGEDNRTTIWFELPESKLNYELCYKTIHDLEHYGIIKIENES